MDDLPDEAWVVRGGENRVEDIRRRWGVHPSGVVGVSVESAGRLTVEALAMSLPHGKVGVTTVGAVRRAGGDVIVTSGQSPHHATLTGLSSEVASRLFNPVMPNPARAATRRI